jgi:hypothetical protein
MPLRRTALPHLRYPLTTGSRACAEALEELRRARDDELECPGCDELVDVRRLPGVEVTVLESLCRSVSLDASPKDQHREPIHRTRLRDRFRAVVTLVACGAENSSGVMTCGFAKP